MSSVPIHPIACFSDPVSCWSHLLGAVVFALVSVVLIPKAAHSRKGTISLIIFSVATISLLAISGVNHLLPHGAPARLVMQRIDHAAIFVLIAATFTPVHTMLFTGFLNWGITAFVWISAVTGITIKTIFFSSIPHWLGLSFYLCLGWFGVVTGILVYRKYGFKFIFPLLCGALAYTAGALVDFADRTVLIHGVIGPHELFHFAVLLGISYHWLFVFKSAYAHGRVAGKIPRVASSNADL